MINSVGFTGMDTSTREELSHAFAMSAMRLGLKLEEADSDQADIVVVDMDSLYGPMSWMQLHNAGRKVIGYSRSSRSQADHTLVRPLEESALDALLGGLGLQQNVVAAPAAAGGEASVPPAATSAPAAPAIEEPAPPVAAVEAAPETIPEAAPAPEPEPEPEPEPVREMTLGKWLASGRLQGRLRYSPEGAQPVFIDTAAAQYHGPATLKPLQALVSARVDESAFAPLDEAAWQAGIAPLGAAQPLSRLTWFAGLMAGEGRILPPHDPEGRYKLEKWLQTEREFPKHFRISTAMMKGPATVAEIAQAANVSEAETADFINACLATGVAQPVLPEPEPVPDTSRTGLLNRLRGR